jgi:type I restriction enzyme S subunit
MEKSILARAFRGELSTNNPNEESALKLLKEVLSERVVSNT